MYYHTEGYEARNGYGHSGSYYAELPYREREKSILVEARHIGLIQEAFPEEQKWEIGETDHIYTARLLDYPDARPGRSTHIHKDAYWHAYTRRCADGSLVCRWGPERRGGSLKWTILTAME